MGCSRISSSRYQTQWGERRRNDSIQHWHSQQQCWGYFPSFSETTLFFSSICSLFFSSPLAPRLSIFRQEVSGSSPHHHHHPFPLVLLSGNEKVQLFCSLISGSRKWSSFNQQVPPSARHHYFLPRPPPLQDKHSQLVLLTF